MMPQVKGTKTPKFQSIFEDPIEDFMKSFNKELYWYLCNCTVSSNIHFFVESHRNTSIHQNALGGRSVLPTLHTLQT